MQRIRLSQTRLLRAEMVCKENRLYNTISIILSIQVITWIRQDLDTVSIKTLQLRNRFSERTPINQYFIIMNTKLLKKLEEIKKEYGTSEVCMGEMLDSVSADGFSIEEAHWLYMRAMEWANGDKFYIHIGEDEDVLSKDELEEANLIVLE